jgi:hypothetical protein
MKKIFFSSIIVLLISCESPKFYENGLDSFNNNELGQAKKFFERVDQNDKNYQKAILMIEKIDSIEVINKEALRIKELENKKQNLKELLQIYMDDDFIKKSKENYSDLNEILTQIYFFDDVVKKAKESKNYEDQELKKNADFLLKKMPEIQKRDFPKMRLAYAKILSKQLWRENIEVNALGNNYSTIQVVSGLFASNANIEDFHNEAVKVFKELRFKRANYKWIPSASEYTYYNISSKNDNQID